MAQFKFSTFKFDTSTLQLTANKCKREIRPKTALLLAFLLDNRERTVSKKELFEAVWQSEYTQDHTLFQLISEIRKLSPGEELIRTQPNIGYQWIALTSQIKPLALRSRMAIAASLTCAVLGVFAFSHTSDQTITKIAMPATSAYAKGVVALENGHIEQAEAMFRFALSENPASSEAQLLLAESLFRLKDWHASETYARAILADTNQSAYSSSMASNILSRIYQQQGLLFDALNYAKKGFDSLDASQSVCTMATIDERIQALQLLVSEQSPGYWSTTQKIDSQQKTDFADQLEGTSEKSIANTPSQNFVERKADSIDDEVKLRCTEFREPQNKKDTSSCINTELSSRLVYLDTRKLFTGKRSPDQLSAHQVFNTYS